MSDPSEGQYRDVERDERWVLVIVAQGGRALRNCGLKADAFELPLHREAFTFLEKYPDWVVPKPGPLYELVIELRAAPAQPIADIFSIVTRMSSAAVAKRAAEQRCPETGDHRYSNSTNDTRTHAGEPGVPQQVAPRSIGPRRRASGRVTSGDLFQKEQNQLRGELRVFFRWKHKDGGKVTDDELKSFISRLSNQLAPRDPLDPNSISPQDLGAHFQLTFARRKQIEDKETVRRANWPTRWPKRYRKPPRFRFHKIGADPADMSPEEIADRYKVERNERYNAKRRTARELKRELAKAMYSRDGYIPYDVMLTNNRMQRKSLLEAITAADMTIRSLMTAVQSDPAWLRVPKAALYRTVVNRLDQLKAGRHIHSRLVSGPKGSRLRLVSRV